MTNLTPKGLYNTFYFSFLKISTVLCQFCKPNLGMMMCGMVQQETHLLVSNGRRCYESYVCNHISIVDV